MLLLAKKPSFKPKSCAREMHKIGRKPWDGKKNYSIFGEALMKNDPENHRIHAQQFA